MQANKHICIITQSHLCRNPRVVKEARLLSRYYNVTIINNTYDAALSIEDEELIAGYNVKLISISQLQNKNIISFTDRLIKKMADWLVKFTGIQTHLALGYGADRFVSAALKLNADAYMGHQELGLYCGCRLLDDGKRVGFDFEDWYSADLLPDAISYRPVKLLRRLEKKALQKGICNITTSNILAVELAGVCNCPEPTVVYNVFNKRDDLLQANKTYEQPLKLFWFSQTIGRGRGLEQFIKLSTAVNHSLEIHLLGNVDADFRSELIGITPAQHQLFFHGPVPDKQLADKIAGFDIGLALELATPPSRDLTITNKFFQYIQAGLPVIASNTRGQTEAFKKFKPGIMLSQHYSEYDGIQLSAWLSNQAELIAARERAIEAAQYYHWENQANQLLSAASRLLEAPFNQTKHAC
ncbi:hypothetical protein CKK33_08205 [Mucilaginibacter sp. MD40]|uniref:hypothetical protein n=1 Tax=Mucilaginibacter sp. MD40 TaxID=2029590 RepID=UPI000BACE619|nr:hypothetical protein [Mucilaginibacter sp. MD40]PAW93472.1 hypothetical protein CKK33_08205 [Mucilaginibacter sp. MD40]